MTNFEIMRDVFTRCPLCKGECIDDKNCIPPETCYFCKGHGRVNTIKKLYYFLIQPIYYKIQAAFIHIRQQYEDYRAK